jgi:carbon-monoxide dehydrogenase medium subunit
MEQFHMGPYETALEAGEMLVEVRLPLRAGHGSAYEKVKRRAGDWATAAAGAALWVPDGRISSAGVALAAVGAPVTCEKAEESLVGSAPTDDVLDEAAALAAEQTNPVDDQRGPADYKRHLAGELARRALRRAAARAQGQEV